MTKKIIITMKDSGKCKVEIYGMNPLLEPLSVLTDAIKQILDQVNEQAFKEFRNDT